MRTALTIAGSDSGGGAGIQADLKSFAAIGVHGTSVITCVTSQNTRTVRSIFPLPVGEIRSQLRAVLEDFEVRSAKTGMLYSADIVGTVADGLRNTDFPLVVDPVMVATVGASLERDGFRDALVDHLLQRATLVTPNRHEAERLAGFSVRTVESMEKAARAIRRLGAGAVLMKGGHVEGKLVDVFYDGRVLRHLEAYRHEKELHGAGCTLAASIAGYLARGESLFEAVESGRHRVAAGFLTAYRAGRGVGIINSHYHPDRFAIAQSLETAGPRLMTALPASRLATWRALLAYALPSAVRGHDIGVLRFRRKVKSGGLEPAGPTTFDAPRFAVKILQAAMLHDPSMRASIHLKLRTKNVGGLQSSGFTVQPHASWRAQGEKGAGVIPDVIVDEGKTHEGTMVIVLGRNPEDVIGKVRRIARAWMP